MRQTSKTRNKRTKRRAKTAIRNVTPLVVKAGAKSSQATIPVAVRTTGDSADAHAVIPVEVQTAEGRTVKRAAVVPVRVRTSSKSQQSTRRRRLQVRRKSHANASHAGKSRQLELIKPAAQRENADLLTRSVVVLTTAEETAVNVAGHLTKRVLAVVPRLLQGSFSLPFTIVGNTADKANQLYDDAKDFAEDLAA